MLLTISMMTISMTISMLLMTMCMIISKKSKNNREKMTPFECGFDPKSSARMPFSMQFFMIAIIFLVFDVEIIILLPTIKMMQTMINMTWMLTTMTFIMILIIGLYHEWNNGMLEWTN